MADDFVDIRVEMMTYYRQSVQDIEVDNGFNEELKALVKTTTSEHYALTNSHEINGTI